MINHLKFNLTQTYIYIVCFGCIQLFVFHNLKGQSTVSETENGPIYHYSQFITKNDLKNLITMLASDSLEGRGFGTRGTFKASEYIASQLRYEGISAKGDRGTYFQPMTINKWSSDKSEFDILTATNLIKNKLKHGQDFNYSLSDIRSEVKMNGSHIMFTGYGILEKNYNDYQYAQVRGEVVMFMEGEPMKDKKYLVNNSIKASRWSIDISLKIETAIQRGARAIFILVDSTKFPLRTEEQIATVNLYSEEISEKYPIPVIRINERSLSKMLSQKEYLKIKKYIAEVKKGKISSNYISTLYKVSLSTKHTVIRDRNVVAVIEGSDPVLKKEYIVISAHYDHIGIVNGEINNGADDNATGTAALISLTKALKALQLNKYPLKRSILFLFCTGEEVGLVGSKYFTRDPIVPMREIKININIDMIGRSDDLHSENENYVYVIGADKINPLLDKSIRENNAWSVNYKLDYTYNDLNHPLRLYYRSDHYNFAEAGIPSVFLFGGFHKDYHRPTDDIFYINFKKVEDITRLVYFTIIDLANQPNPILTQYKDN